MRQTAKSKPYALQLDPLASLRVRRPYVFADADSVGALPGHCYFDIAMPTIQDYMLTIDLAHPARPPARVETELQDTLIKVRNSKHWRAIKVVHGYGSHGKGGSTRETVRAWAYQFRRHFRTTINGEDYSIFDGATQEMRAECGQLDDSDLGVSNSGITILWVK